MKKIKWAAVLLGTLLLCIVATEAARYSKEYLIEEAVQEMRKQQEAEKQERERDRQPGYILIHTTDGEEWGFYGDMEIISDGTDGTDIDIDMTGWLVGSTHPCYNPEAEEAGWDYIGN